MRASSEIRASPQVRSISARPGWHQGGDVRETLARRPGAGTVAPRPVRNKKTFPNDGGVCRRGKIPPAWDTFRVTPIPCRVRSVQIHGPNRSTIHGLELALRDPGQRHPRRAVDRLVRGTHASGQVHSALRIRPR
jgi:hypothetical protein